MGRRLRRTLSTLGTAAVLVVAYRYVVAPRLGERGIATFAPTITPASNDTPRIVVWNLENFGDDPARARRAIDAMAELDAGIFALVEIRDGDALRRAFPDRRVFVSRRGGRGGQHLAFVVDPQRFEMLDPPVEFPDLAMGGRVRPGYAIHVRALPEGPDLHLALVHLKAMPEGAALRRRQWHVVRKWIDGLRSDGERDLLLVGDFNPVGGHGRDEAAELAELARTFADAGLELHTPPGACSAYWEGPRRDAWKEPTLLDLVFVGDLGEALPADGPLVRAAGACARTGCTRVRSTRARPDPQVEGTSDHCPLVVDLRPGDDDP